MLTTADLDIEQKKKTKSQKYEEKPGLIFPKFIFMKNGIGNKLFIFISYYECVSRTKSNVSCIDEAHVDN